MKIEEALKDTGKATNKYNPCNGTTGYAGWYKGDLFWFDKDSGDRRCILTHKEIFDDDWQSYHPKGEIRPEEAGELWKDKDGVTAYTHGRNLDIYVTMEGDTETPYRLNEVSWHKGIIHGQGWERIYPPVEDGSVERIVIEDINFDMDIGRKMVYIKEYSKIKSLEILDRPPMTVILEIPKEK